MAEFLATSQEILNNIFSQLFSKFIVAVVILLIGFVMGRVVGKLVQKFLHEIEINRILKKSGANFDLEGVLSHLFTYFIYFITVIWALNTLGLTTTILNIISIAFMLLIIISIFLAVKDFVPNLISGFFIHSKNMIKPGDKIKVDNVNGTVMKISLVETEIKTASGDIMHIPNSILTRKEIIVRKKN